MTHPTRSPPWSRDPTVAQGRDLTQHVGTLLRVATPPVRFVYEPGAVYREQIASPRPFSVIAVVLGLVFFSIWQLAPFMRAELETAPILAANQSLVDTIVWTNIGICTTGHVYLLVACVRAALDVRAAS